MQNIKHFFHPTGRCDQENLSRAFPPWGNRPPVSLEQEIHDIDRKCIQKKEVDHPPTRDGKDPIEHKRGKGDPNSEKHIVFQDLKELIQVTPAIKTIGNIANVKGYKMQEIENGNCLRRVFCILKKTHNVS